MTQQTSRTGGGGPTTDLRDLPRAKLRLAQAALLWERLWPAVWPAVLVAGLFLVVALLDLLPYLPGWLHLLVLLGFAAAFALALWRNLSGFRFPDLGAAARRLERDGGVLHRPLSALVDRPAGRGDPAAESLWEAHRRRLMAELKRLRLLPPRAGLARRDPLALRAGLLLLLVVAVAAAGHDWRGRLADAAVPQMGGWGRGTPPILDLWITPPAYTGAAPVVLSVGMPAEEAAAGQTSSEPGGEAEQRALTVPEGSRVVGQLQGGRGDAVLMIGDIALPFDETEPDSRRVEGAILTGDRLAVQQNERVVAEWAMNVTPDEAPQVALTAPPAATERAALRLEFEATDDYGVTSVVAVIRRADGMAAPDGEQQIELPLTHGSVPQPKAKGTSYHDLAPHPWAGLPVEMHLVARDGLDQTGRSETVSTVLPEREFRHPVARAIIAERKKLILDPNDRRSVGRNLAAIGAVPEAFDNDVVVSLALRSAQRRLLLNPGPEATAEVVELLWDTALRVEDGGLAIAERELRAAQEKLQEALAGDATDAEIERLMDELQRALDKFLAALAEQMRQQAEAGAMQPLDPNATVLSRDDLQELIDRAREMAKTGAREAARDLLAQLQEMLENLQAAMPMMGDPSGQQAEALSMMRDLDELARRQQELLDRSFQQSQQGRSQQGQPQPGQGGQQQGSGQQGLGQQGEQGDAAAQEALRRGLGDIMRRFGEMTGDIPLPLGRAERAMKEAVEALGQGMPGEAIGPQTEALEALQQAGQAMAESLMQQLGPQPGMGPGQQQLGRNRDPLGRTESGNGVIDTGDVGIPEKSDLQRSREILDELRRRAGQRQRPEVEQEYIERLLRRF